MIRFIRSLEFGDWLCFGFWGFIAASIVTVGIICWKCNHP